MDTFIEQLVKKKLGPADYAVIAGTLLAGLTLAFLAVLFLLPLALFVLAGVAYGAYELISSRNLEFEYSVTNGDITIDKVINRRKRRPVISIEAHELEEMGPCTPGRLEEKKSGKRVIAAGTGLAEGAWYFCARHPKQGNVLVVFNPNEKVLRAIRPFLKGEVADNAFRRH